MSLLCVSVFFLMIRRPPRSTLDRSSAASDVYKRQVACSRHEAGQSLNRGLVRDADDELIRGQVTMLEPVSYTHLRAHETVLDLVCRLLLEKKRYSKIRRSGIVIRDNS